MPASQKPIWRRFMLCALLVLSGLCIALPLTWQLLKQRWEVQHFSIDGWSLAWGRLHIDSAQLSLGPAANLHIQVKQLALDWSLLRLRSIEIAHLSIQQTALNPTEPSPSLEMDSLNPAHYLPSWLPEQLYVRQLSTELPCASGICALQGQLHYTRQSSPQLRLELQHHAHLLTLEGNINDEALALTLSTQDKPIVQLTSDWLSEEQTAIWQGQASLNFGQEHAWLGYLLQPWLEQSLPVINLPEAISLEANWRFNTAQNQFSLSHLLKSAGHINFKMQIDRPWPIAQLASVQGNLSVALISDGQWQAQHLQTQLLVTDLATQAITDFGELQLNMHAEHLTLGQTERPLELSFQTTGPSQLQGSASISVAHGQDDWPINITNFNANLSIPNLQLAGFSAEGLAGQLNLQGHFNQTEQVLEALTGSQLKIKQLRWAEHSLTAEQLVLTLQKTILTLNAQHEPTAKGQLNLSIEALEHPTLKKRQWALSSQWNLASSQHLTLTGTVNNDAGLNSPVTLSLHNWNQLAGHVGPASWSFHQTNPLADSLADWPPSLELSNGSASLRADVSLQASQLTSKLQLKVANATGQMANTPFSDLNAELLADIGDEQLKLSIANLLLKQLNPGVLLQDISFSASYSTPLAKLAAGELNWHKVQAKLFAGELSLADGHLNLNQTNPAQMLHLSELDLALLLQAYPTDGLSGEGIIEGELPLHISPNGVSITDGHIRAKAPGSLQFSNAKLQTLALNNPAMAVVAQALQEFHYSRLESLVAYSEQGKLQLALKLEGFSPKVEQGRAINLNINLEEDIPALLRSLQLSGKVSDTIQEHVQQRAQPTNASP